MTTYNAGDSDGFILLVWSGVADAQSANDKGYKAYNVGDYVEAAEVVSQGGEQGYVRSITRCTTRAKASPKMMPKRVWFRKGLRKGMRMRRLIWVDVRPASATQDDAEAVKWYRKSAEQ